MRGEFVSGISYSIPDHGDCSILMRAHGMSFYVSVSTLSTFHDYIMIAYISLREVWQFKKYHRGKCQADSIS